MPSRLAVLLIHSVFLRPAGLIPCKPIASVSPLFVKLTKSANLHYSTVFSYPLFSYACALFCTFLRLPKTQSFCYQSIPHSLEKTEGCGGATVWFVNRNLWQSDRCVVPFKTTRFPKSVSSAPREDWFSAQIRFALRELWR